MKIGAYLAPSKLRGPYDPGHMSIWWENNGAISYRGFWPDTLALPANIIDKPVLRAKFFRLNSVPGEIVDDAFFIRDLLDQYAKHILCVTWDASAGNILQVSLAASPRPFATYSFKPSAFPNCHNCVTWAAWVINEVLGEVLKTDPDGRIARMIAEFKTKRPNGHLP